MKHQLYIIVSVGLEELSWKIHSKLELFVLLVALIMSKMNLLLDFLFPSNFEFEKICI